MDYEQQYHRFRNAVSSELVRRQGLSALEAEEAMREDAKRMRYQHAYGASAERCARDLATRWLERLYATA